MAHPPRLSAAKVEEYRVWRARLTWKFAASSEIATSYGPCSVAWT